MVLAGDVERAQELVFNSRGIQRARDLAARHAELAVQAVSSHAHPFVAEMPRPLQVLRDTQSAE